jgi:Phosphatidylinositol 3- and 4-kinase/Phosphoinositide 3-kinase family, accessory domain (PIK domain)/Phosphoinositide 3-kinase C2/PI3-kinase family, ras-binding domain
VVLLKVRVCAGGVGGFFVLFADVSPLLPAEMLSARTHAAFLLRPSSGPTSVVLSMRTPGQSVDHIQVVIDSASGQWCLVDAKKDVAGRYPNLRQLLMHTPQLRGFDPVRNPKNQDLTTYARTRQGRMTVYGGASPVAKAPVAASKNVALPQNMLTVKDRLDLLTQQWMPAAVSSHDSSRSPQPTRSADRPVRKASFRLGEGKSRSGESQSASAIPVAETPSPAQPVQSTAAATAPVPTVAVQPPAPELDVADDDDSVVYAAFPPADSAVESPQTAAPAAAATRPKETAAPASVTKSEVEDGATEQPPTSATPTLEDILQRTQRTAAPRSNSFLTKPKPPTNEKAFWDSEDFFADVSDDEEEQTAAAAAAVADTKWQEEIQRELEEQQRAQESERRRLAEEAAARETAERTAVEAQQEQERQRGLVEKAVLLTGEALADEQALLDLRAEALAVEDKASNTGFSTWIVVRCVIPSQVNTGSDLSLEALSTQQHTYVGVRIRLSHTVTQLKSCVWRFLQSVNVKPPRQDQADCVFVVDGDDFLVDEGDRVDKQPYVLFSLTNQMVPQLVLVDKRELQLMNMQSLSAVGKPLVWTVSQIENDHFRKQMNRIHYNKYILRSDNFEDTRIPEHLPAQIPLLIEFSANVTKTVQMSNTATVGDLMTTIFTQYLGYLSTVLHVPQEQLRPENFVLKLRGREEFLLNDKAILSCNSSVTEILRKREKVSLLLLQQHKVMHNLAWIQRSDWHEQRKYGDLDPSNVEDVRSDGVFAVMHGNDIRNCEHTMRLRISRLENIAPHIIAAGFKHPQKHHLNLWVTAGIFLASDPILAPDSLREYEAQLGRAPPRGQDVTLTSNYLGPKWYSAKTDEYKFTGGNPPAWSASWIDTGVRYKDVPWAALLHCVLWAAPVKDKKAKPVCIGWVNMRLTDYRDRIRQGFHSLHLQTRTPPNPQAPIFGDFDEDSPKLSVEIEVKDSPFFPTGLLFDLDPDLMRKLPSPSFGEFRDKLLRLFETDPLYRLTNEDKVLLWQYRGWCFSEQHQKSIFKFCYSVPWASGDKVREFYSLIDNWPVLDEPQWSLELLQPRFLDRHVRGWVVRNLMHLTDNDLSQFLLQLVQALKHEIHHDSVLARFLLMRAWLNTTKIGHQLFWVMKVETQQIEFTERFELLLEGFVRGCGPSFRDEIIKETQLAESLVGVATAVQSASKSKRLPTLQSALDPNAPPPPAAKGAPPPPKVQMPRNFIMPATPTVIASNILVSECKSMESKTCPLWLTFSNLDPQGSNISAIFKVGDDLRQDQLTLQMIDVFDRMWLRAGLDLRTTVYPVVATGPDMGWIGVVHNAKTCAEIQKATGAGALKAAFNEKVLANWLKEQNPSEVAYEAAVDNFIRSTAGSCIATYILGIGDRHNDNIMLRKNGQLFHIDFGMFLGNAQMAMGVSRDRAPFVFTPDMAYVMGGTKSDNFAKFVDLCCTGYNICRANAHGVINLFAMIVGTGIPQLQSEEDLDYLREALALDLDPDAAAAKFKNLIMQSLSTTSTRLNFAVHILANPD